MLSILKDSKAPGSRYSCCSESTISVSLWNHWVAAADCLQGLCDTSPQKAAPPSMLLAVLLCLNLGTNHWKSAQRQTLTWEVQRGAWESEFLTRSQGKPTLGSIDHHQSSRFKFNYELQPSSNKSNVKHYSIKIYSLFCIQPPTKKLETRWNVFPWNKYYKPVQGRGR